MIPRSRVVVVLFACLLLTPIAWSQVGSPSTRPTEPDPRVAELIQRLSADDFATRQRAEDELVEMGPAIEASLRRLLEQATDEEVRSRLQSALVRLAEQQRIGPTRITLRLKNASAKEAFKALWAQLNRPVPVQGDFVLDGSPDKVTLDCVDEPFWSVLLKLTEQTGIGLQGPGEGGQLVMQGKGKLPPCYVSGPVLIRAETAQRSYTIQYANPDASSSDFSVNFSVWAEPKLDLAGSPAIRNVRITRAEDEQGREMLEKQGGSWRSTGATSFAVRLRGQHADAKKLAVLSGTIVLPVNLRYLTVEHDKLNEKVTHQVGDLRVVFDPVLQNSDRMYHIKVTVFRDTASDEAWSAINHQIFGSVQVFDADGQPLDRGGWGSSSPDGLKIEGNLNYTRVRRGDKDTGEPAKLIWRIPVERKEIELPFEFRDLPLPG